MTGPLTVDLGSGVMFEVWRDLREVRTLYPDDLAMGAQRPDTPENRAEAADQGYVGQDAVWRALVEHELLHTLVARRVFGRDSLVLRHECGGERARYALRLHEEALVLSFQRWANTFQRDPVLEPYKLNLLDLLTELHRVTRRLDS